MTEFRQEYELSIWEDVSSAEESGLGRFEERKIAVIGAHDLHTPTKAFNVTLKENVNGEKTLTFSIPRMYRDKSGELVDNPFLSLLTAERKLKFRDGEAYVCKETDIDEIVRFQETEDDQNKWYDFVIKSIDEDRDKYVNNYTCKELFVNELGKNGWNIVLDEELMNNYGTLTELGKSVLEGSDWTIDASSFLPNEKVAEPLFYGEVSGLKAKDKDGNSVEISGTIYPFFSQLTYVTKDEETKEGAWKANSALSTIQFLYRSNGFSETDLDDNRTVIDDNSDYNYFAAPADLSDVDFVVTGGTGNAQDTAIQGKKLVNSIRGQYEPISKKYVNLYTANEDILVDGNVAVEANDGVYHYKESVYIAPEMVTNLIANATAFVTTTGWQTGDTLKDKITPITYPVYEGKLDNNTSYESFTPANYLKFSQIIYNIGPDANRIDCKEGDEYIVRVKTYKQDENGTPIPYDGNLQANFVIDQFDPNEAAEEAKKENPNYDKFYPIISTSGEWKEVADSSNQDESWRYVKLTITQSISRSGDDVYLQIVPDSEILLQNIQLFPYIQTGEKEEDFLAPDSIPNAQLIYEDHYFYINDNKEVVELPNISSYYSPVSNGYTAVRNLSVKESNYFNNVNSLAELFECWVAFKVKHCKNGKLWLQDNKPVKTVVFSQYSPTGKENSAGFRYGKNIKSIKRTVKSDTVASKLIVKNNNNEFAVDGMASITRAVDNPIADNIVYNFDYYIAHGLLDATTLYRDLYGMSSNDFGYYRELKRINDELLPINEQIVAVQHNLYSAQEWLNSYEMALQSAIEKEEEEKADYGHTWNLWYGSNAPDGTVNNKITEAAHDLSTATARRIEYEKEVVHYTALVEQYKKVLADNSDDGLLQRAQNLKDEKIALNEQFYVKYARFIQEATWTDEKYVDDNLYYYDAKKVSAQNAWPKTSYTIGAIEIGIIPKYAAYAFTIGDRSYIEDTEFFGYTYIPNPMDNGNSLIKTPVRKEVVISERSRNFDDPSKSTLSIKTYKNQFEDLFSKLTATTQSLQYSSGEYQRAANTVNADGSLSVESLESTFANNAFVLANAANQSVLWDSGSGIEVKNLANSAELVRVVSNGIMLSDNGGKTWTTGISARGINTRLLTAGTINASNINIYSGASDSIFAFRWSDSGINAIVPGEGGSKYVRFNELGLYGTEKGLSLDEALNKVNTFAERIALVTDRQYTNFALTWEGLNLAYQDGALSLQPKSGLEIFGDSKFSEEYIGTALIGDKRQPDGQTEYMTDDYIPLISIGKYYGTILDDNNNLIAAPVYGLRMRNDKGDITLETDGTTGNLWLRDELSIGLKAADTSETEEGSVIGYKYATAGIKGKVENLTDTAFWAGDKFKVQHDGMLFAQDAEITGRITAKSGEITGVLSVGEHSFINTTDYAFKSGNNFSVDKMGNLIANNAQITGVIVATSGSFSGEIVAKSGSIEKISFGKERQSYIGGKDDTVLSINDNFTVSQNGELVAKNLILGDTVKIEIAVDKENPIKIGNSFTIDEEGNTKLKDLDFSGVMTTGTDGLLLGENGKIKLGANMVIANGGISNGNNWSINADGTAKFANASINGTLQSTVFEHNRTSAIAGDLWVAPSFIVDEYTILQDTNSTIINFSDNENLANIWSKVTEVKINDDDDAVAASFDENTKQLTISTVLNKGQKVMSITSSINHIKITANDVHGPYIELGLGDKQTTVLGNLDSVTDDYFGELQGHGLYSQNAYLTGKLYLPNAGITNEGTESTSVRIWAGGSAADAQAEDSKVPFRVLQDGSLYASKGIFSGQVNAVDSYFSGVLSAAGVVLKDDDGNDATAEHQRFFFHYDKSSKNQNEQKFDHIAAIESDGFKLYSGGLKIYETSASFISDKEPDVSDLTPIFEVKTTGNSTLTRIRNLEIFDENNNINLQNGLISFTNGGKINGNLSLDVQSSVTRFTDQDGSNKVMEVAPSANSVYLYGALGFNTQTGQSAIEVETLDDGIVFNYVGA